jgi:hypothetical protein
MGSFSWPHWKEGRVRDSSRGIVGIRMIRCAAAAPGLRPAMPRVVCAASCTLTSAEMFA